MRNKREGGVQCEILSDSTVPEVREPRETSDKYVLTDDPYCEDITEVRVRRRELVSRSSTYTPSI